MFKVLIDTKIQEVNVMREKKKQKVQRSEADVECWGHVANLNKQLR